MATLAEIRKQALVKLGVATPHQTPKAYLDDAMKAAYDEAYTKLRDKDLVFWSQTASVPDNVSNEIAAMMAWSRVNDFGVSSDRYTRIANEQIKAEPSIRIAAVSKHISVDEPEDF